MKNNSRHKPSKKPHTPWQQAPTPEPRHRSAESRPSRGKDAARAGRGARAASPESGPIRSGAGKGRSTRPPVPGKGNSTAPAVTETAPFPLNKFLAHTGLCARRKAVEYIKSGEVTVNGRVVTEPGFKVTAKDDIRYQNRRMRLKQVPVYILLNKPKGCITTTSDPRARHTVMDLVAGATSERVYPVGRLDRNTSGLLLLTNDGDLAQLLAHPSYEVVKVYHVSLDRALTKNDFDRILEGVTLEDGHTPVDSLAYEEADDKTQIGIEIHSGRNRIVRRIFESLGYEIRALDRVLYAGLTKKNLPRGKWRLLTDREVRNLKHFSKGR